MICFYATPRPQSHFTPKGGNGFQPLWVPELIRERLREKGRHVPVHKPNMWALLHNPKVRIIEMLIASFFEKLYAERSPGRYRDQDTLTRGASLQRKIVNGTLRIFVQRMMRIHDAVWRTCASAAIFA